MTFLLEQSRASPETDAASRARVNGIIIIYLHQAQVQQKWVFINQEAPSSDRNTAGRKRPATHALNKAQHAPRDSSSRATHAPGLSPEKILSSVNADRATSHQNKFSQVFSRRKANGRNVQHAKPTIEGGVLGAGGRGRRGGGKVQTVKVT